MENAQSVEKLLNLHLEILFLKSGTFKWTLFCPSPNGQNHILGDMGCQNACQDGFCTFQFISAISNKNSWCKQGPKKKRKTIWATPIGTDQRDIRLQILPFYLYTGFKWSQAGQDQSERHKKGICSIFLHKFQSTQFLFTSFNQLIFFSSFNHPKFNLVKTHLAR